MADPNTRTYESPRRYPALRFNNDWRGLHRECYITMIMRAGAQIGVLRDDAMLTDGYFRQAIERRPVAYPAVVADFNFPWENDSDARPYQYVSTYFGTKKPPRETPP